MSSAVAFFLGAVSASVACFIVYRVRVASLRASAADASRTNKALLQRVTASEASRVQIIEELSHDLRTPLTSILTLFESISDAKALTPEYVRECASVAIPEIEYVNHLIRDLFLLAQMGEPGYAPAREAVALGDLASECVDQLRGVAQVSWPGITFELKVPGSDGAGPVLGDPHLLRRLMRNVLSNSARHARKTVKIGVEPLGKHAWKLTVDDDGPGFDPAAVDTFFGAHRPNMDGKKASDTSLGLGSVIIHRIVKLHGASLRIFNKEGPGGERKGAVVQITFPGAMGAYAKAS